MCGFLGEINFNGNLSDSESFKNLLKLSKPRGPDQTRIEVVGDRIRFAFNRLAILDLSERKLILSSLKQIDRIISYETESDLYDILQKEKIDIRFLGDDYREKSFTGDDLNIPIYYLDRSHGWSTTKFKKLIAETV